MEVGSASSCSNSSSSSTCSASASGSLNGLKFDKISYFGESKSPSLVVQTPVRCRVEGCQFDLSSVKGYYYRHRVCGIHSKSAKVVVNGVEQRFCQQCSRFHLVGEFDKGKRSCRRRLACHNQRRRRKPPSGTLFTCNETTESSVKAGSFMLDFSMQPPPEEALGENAQTHPWHRKPPEIATRRNNTDNKFGSRECLTGVSDCSRALSLLSTQKWDSRQQSSIHNGVVNALVTTPPMNMMVQQPPYSYSLRNNEESNTLCMRGHMSTTELGLIETSQPAAGNQYHYHGHLDDVVPEDDSGFVGLLEHSVEYESDSYLPAEHSRGLWI